MSGARFTKYLTTIVRLSYDNAKVTIDVRFMCKTVMSSEAAFVN